jgi:hypothetical protein
MSGLAAETVEQQTERALPGVGGGFPGRLDNSGVRHQKEDQVLRDEVGAKRSLGLGPL